MIDLFDPEGNFFNTHGFSNTTYFTPENLKSMIKENNDISFSVLHLNIESLNKNFEKLRKLLVGLVFCFKIICTTESWCFDNLLTNNEYQLLNFVSTQQVRKNGKTGDGITIFIGISL